MKNVVRMYPGALNGLINWMEQNFHDIDQFVVTFTLKDGSMMTIYDTYSYLEAIGLAGITTDTINQMARDGNFIPKERPPNG